MEDEKKQSEEAEGRLRADVRWWSRKRGKAAGCGVCEEGVSSSQLKRVRATRPHQDVWALARTDKLTNDESERSPVITWTNETPAINSAACASTADVAYASEAPDLRSWRV